MFNLFQKPAIAEIDPKTAYEEAKKGELVLVDVRNPNEWMKTGIPEPAVPISLQDPQFLNKLEEATGGDRNKKVAFICASGGRSSQVTQAVPQYGWKNAVNVAGGVMGSRTQPGWVQLGLPTKPFNG